MGKELTVLPRAPAQLPGPDSPGTLSSSHDSGSAPFSAPAAATWELEKWQCPELTQTT